MREECRLSTNTIARHMKSLKRYVNVARKKGIITEYPFLNYTIRTEQVHRDALTEKELEILEKYRESLSEPNECFKRFSLQLLYWPEIFGCAHIHKAEYLHCKRLLNYILCIRFFIEVHSIVSASRFFHMPTYLRVVIECQSRFFPFFPAFSRNCPDYFLHTSGSSSFRSLSDLGAR